MTIRNLTMATILFTAAGLTHADEITFADLTTGLSGSLIYADVSIDGTLLNASTGDTTGIKSGNSNSSNWGIGDSSSSANGGTTPITGNNEALNLNVLEGRHDVTANPELKWTFSSGSGDSGGNGAGTLAANTTYQVYVHFLVHTSNLQKWGIETANNAAFTDFHLMNNDDGMLITSVSPDNVNWRRDLASFTVTTDGSGNAELWIRRPTSGISLRTTLDGVVLSAAAGIPTPAALPAGMALLGFVAMRRRR